MGLRTSEGEFHRVVAIDGPAASGKSSVARWLAGCLGFIYVHLGAVYRAIKWYLLEKGIYAEDSNRIAEALESAAITGCIQDNESRILIDNADPVAHLRDDRVNENVSRVSKLPAVRKIVGQNLHQRARNHDLVVEGRDIGSVVFPQTPYKFYVDASPEVRLRRRAAQGERDEIVLRDHADFSRSVSPLVIAEDAYVIDTSHLAIEAVVNKIMARLKQMGLQIWRCRD